MAGSRNEAGELARKVSDGSGHFLVMSPWPGGTLTPPPPAGYPREIEGALKKRT